MRHTTSQAPNALRHPLTLSMHDEQEGPTLGDYVGSWVLVLLFVGLVGWLIKSLVWG